MIHTKYVIHCFRRLDADDDVGAGVGIFGLLQHGGGGARPADEGGIQLKWMGINQAAE